MTREEFDKAIEAGIKKFEVADASDWGKPNIPINLGDVVEYDQKGSGDENTAFFIVGGKSTLVMFERLKLVDDVCTRSKLAAQRVHDATSKREQAVTPNMDCEQPNPIQASVQPSQTAKADAGKPRLSLVPTQIIHDIAQVREYGNKKYGDSENWRTVEMQRYVDATYRHWLDFIKDPNSKDVESGIEHYKHVACNMAFICEMMEDEK